MSVTYGYTGQPVTETELAQVEQRLGRTIPASYRMFLLEHNGGRPEPQAFIIYGHDNVPFDEGAVDFFFSVRPGQFDNLEDNIETFDGRIPAHFFPIAADPGGNLLCISTAGNNKDVVYFWDHEEEADNDEPGHDNVYFVARSFDGLLNNLTEPR